MADCCFDRESEQFTCYQHDENDPHSLGDDDVLTIFQDRFGTLWIGTREGRMTRVGSASAGGTFTR